MAWEAKAGGLTSALAANSDPIPDETRITQEKSGNRLTFPLRRLKHGKERKHGHAA